MVSCTLHFANLFPSSKSFVLGVIPTALLISGFLLTIFQYLVKAGIPLYALFIAYSCVQLFFLTFVSIWQPMQNFSVKDLPDRRNKKEKTEEEIKEKLEEKSKQSIELNEIKQEEEETINEPISTEESTDEPKIDESVLDEEILVEEEINEELEEKATEEQKTDVLDEGIPKKEKKKRCVRLVSVLKQAFTADYFLGGFFLCIQSLIYTWYTGTLYDQFFLKGDFDHCNIQKFII